MHITPYLCASNAAQALAFYRDAFGAVEDGSRIMDDTGRIGHAQFTLGDTRCYIADEHKEINVCAPDTLGGSPVSFTLEVDNVDATYQRALAAGAKSLSKPEDQFYGARVASVQDPAGYRWSLSKQNETLSDDELQARVAGEYTLEKPS